MSATRLLVLGAVRIMQPVHGYDVRRELISWRIEESANVKPGSIYSALKTLEKDGLIEVTDQSSKGGRPERTSYALTVEGEKEFQLLLRESWWSVHRPAIPLIPALCLLPHMPREELIAALSSRVSQLSASVEGTRFLRESIKDGATGADGGIPEHVREIADFQTAHLKAELTWTKQLIARLRDGTYQLAGEADWLDLGAGKGIHQP
jgi:DNA-binding PadR family transcriptional regulator